LTELLGNVRSTEGRRALFNLLDVEEKKAITFDNLRNLAKEVGHIISDDEIREIAAAMSKNPKITADEFEKYLSKKLSGNAK